jgi:hypothetical protein
MKIMNMIESIHELCKATNQHGVRLQVDKNKAKPKAERIDSFCLKCATSEILKNRFSQDISPSNQENYNRLAWALDLEDVIFGEEHEIKEMIRIFEEMLEDSYIYFNPNLEQIVVVCIDPKTQIYDRF